MITRKQLNMIRERIRAEWGDTCDDHDVECPVCAAWDGYYAARKAFDTHSPAPSPSPS